MSITNIVKILSVSVFSSLLALGGVSTAQEFPRTTGNPLREQETREQETREEETIEESITQPAQNETIPEIFGRGFNHASGDFFDFIDWPGQFDFFFGYKYGLYSENQMARDAEIISIIYYDYMRQMRDTSPIIRTRDLASPYQTSIQENPDYTRNVQRGEF